MLAVFPARAVRSTAQAQALKEHLPVDMVMNLDVPKQVIVDRLTDRWIHPGSGRVYAYAYRPPKVRRGVIYLGRQRLLPVNTIEGGTAAAMKIPGKHAGSS